MANLTISDIAKMAGVGTATVSRCLNNTGYVSESTRKKIEMAVEKSGYVPSAAAQNLSRRTTGTIGLIIPEADNPFFSSVVNGVTEIADESGFTLLLCNTNNSPAKDLRALQIMKRQRVCGLIFTPAAEYQDSYTVENVCRYVKGLNCPVVILDRTLDNLNCDSVLSENFRGAYDATMALIKAGHTQIGIVSGDLDLDIGRERMRGFQTALSNMGLPLVKDYIIPGKFDSETSYRFTKRLLEQGKLPTAIFASNNLCSRGFLKAIYEAGLTVPEDISYIGFDDVKGINLFGNKFSYMERDVAGMGRRAMHLLLNRMEKPYAPVQKVRVPLSPKLYGSEKMGKTKG